ncbi:hypothetical protein [Malaciobacter mytili]|uniref:hypothetical protein n=1 Tax=Malaciobacter mytili TaxID=603050 RepID=UPI003A8C26BF
MNKEEIVSNDFLFEIEDYNYLLNKFCGWFVVLIAFLFILFYFKSGELLALKNDGHRGYLLVTSGGTYIVFEAIKMLIYVLKDKKETIKFYKNYIYRTNNNLKVSLENIEEAYIAKYNIASNKIPWRISNFSTILALILGPIILVIPFFISRFVYSIFKGKKYTLETNNLILLQNNYNKYCISIALNIATKDDIEKLNLYLNKYLHTDINKIEKIFYKIPEWKRKNL